MATEGSKDFVRVILSFFIPPVGVFLQVGMGTAFWINLILTLLAGVPGQLHAAWVIASVGEDGKEVDEPMSTFIALILSFYLPPIAVFMKAGAMMALLNVVLTFLFFVPGVLHALWVVTHADDA